MEDDEEVVKALKDDVVHELLNDMLIRMMRFSIPWMSQELRIAKCPGPSPQPTFLTEKMGDLEEVATRCGMQDVTCYLRKAKLATASSKATQADFLHYFYYVVGAVISMGAA